MEEQTEVTSYESLRTSEADLLALDGIIKDLPKAVETKVRLANVFSSIHQKMNEGLDYNIILDSIFDSLKQIIPFQRIGLALIENNGLNIRFQWVKANLQVRYLRPMYIAPLEESSLKDIIETGRSRIINDLEIYLQQHPKSRSTKLILKDGIRSNLTCPLIVDGIPIGVIFFSSEHLNTYGNIHIEVFCEISDGLAVIIEQALLKKKVAKIAAKEKMFRDTIHDLNNPLCVIQSVLNMMTKKPWFKELGEDSKKAFSTLKRNSDAMINLVQEIVYTVKEEKKEHFLNPENVSMATFLSNIQIDAQAMAEKKNIQVQVHTDKELPPMLKFDSQKVKQALDNLLANAVKFSPEKSNVDIKIFFFKETKMLHFIVSDQGPGIAKEYLPKLFQATRKIDTKTSGEKSSGRGLLNVKHLIQSLGGEVSVTSELGKGSSFGFNIPTNDSDLQWQ